MTYHDVILMMQTTAHADNHHHMDLGDFTF